MGTDSVLILGCGLAVTGFLSWLNWRLAFAVHQWGGDGKNIYTFLSKRLRPDILARDFPFSNAELFRAYQPAYAAALLWLARHLSGDLRKAFAVMHPLVTLVAVTGWLALVRRLTDSLPVALLGLLVVVPFTSVISADGIGVGAPRSWWSRSTSNALIPWFIMLIDPAANRSLVPAAALVAVMFNLHPTASIGLMPLLAYLIGVRFLEAALAGPEMATLAGILALGVLPFAVNYVRTTAGGRTAFFFADLVPTTAHLAYPWIMGYDLYPLTTLENKKRWIPEAVKNEWLCFFAHDPQVPAAYLREREGKVVAEPVHEPELLATRQEASGG